MSIWQIGILVGVGINLVYSFAYHGDIVKHKNNFWHVLLSEGVLLFMLYKGGFF